MEHTKQFVHHISKELVNLMPIAQFDGETIIVDQPEQVEKAVKYLRSCRIIGIDTESRPSFTRGIHYPTALLQVASEQRCYLFRLNKIGMPIELAHLFSNKNICKIIVQCIVIVYLLFRFTRTSVDGGFVYHWIFKK